MPAISCTVSARTSISLPSLVCSRMCAVKNLIFSYTMMENLDSHSMPPRDLGPNTTAIGNRWQYPAKGRHLNTTGLSIFSQSFRGSSITGAIYHIFGIQVMGYTTDPHDLLNLAFLTVCAKRIASDLQRPSSRVHLPFTETWQPSIVGASEVDRRVIVTCSFFFACIIFNSASDSFIVARCATPLTHFHIISIQ